jgi:hypothetical protein
MKASCYPHNATVVDMALATTTALYHSIFDTIVNLTGSALPGQGGACGGRSADHSGLAGYPPPEIRQQLLEVQQLIWDAMGAAATHGSHANGHTNRQIVTALYENEVLHPTAALGLEEAQVVTIQIMPVPEGLAL